MSIREGKVLQFPVQETEIYELRGVETVDGRRVLRNVEIDEDLTGKNLGDLTLENVVFTKRADITDADLRGVKLISRGGQCTVKFNCKGVPLCDSVIADVIARDYFARIKGAADNSRRPELNAPLTSPNNIALPKKDERIFNDQLDDMTGYSWW